MGAESESYDDIIQRLIRGEISWKRMDERWNRILEEDEFIPLAEF